MNFRALIDSILQTHLALEHSAVKAVNKYLTIRSWLIGFYILNFEQRGEDRAMYGLKLLENIADQLKATGIKGLTAPELSRFRQFYSAYPYILGTVSQELENLHLRSVILETPSQQLTAFKAEEK